MKKLQELLDALKVVREGLVAQKEQTRLSADEIKKLLELKRQELRDKKNGN